ncbi:ROK family protein [Photobacterium sp. GJ3]|uniref:ROK family protein n=1 Tax=Photobacterium sp. GJ3 TaxID=2829502 RepID=UPI0020127ECB|nr:ROK family protein [Photobacterium sp. GJ3]
MNVLVDNDCVMLALAEKWMDGRSEQDFCILNIDYGIGSSFLINNQIYRGKMFGSGQIGHIKAVDNGTVCGCGREGCLETEASSKALCRKYRQQSLSQKKSLNRYTKEDMGFSDFVALYLEQDPIALSVAECAATIIGQSLYNLLITLNINKIILYGNTCSLGKPWLDTIKQQTLANPFEDKYARRQDQTLLCFGNLSEVERIIGMSYLWVEQELDSLFGW